MLRYVPLIGIKEARPIHMKPVDPALACEDMVPVPEEASGSSLGALGSEQKKQMKCSHLFLFPKRGHLYLKRIKTGNFQLTFFRA